MENIYWDFIDYMLKRFGFGLKWRKWIKTCIATTSFVVMVNRGPSTFFKASRRLRQGDPLSPILFIMVMEALNKLIEQSRNLNLIKGINVGKEKNIEISRSFFAIDTLIFCQPDVSMLLLLRCVLLCFQVVLRLRINMSKSIIIMVETGINNNVEPLAMVLKCKTAKPPIILWDLFWCETQRC